MHETKFPMFVLDPETLQKVWNFPGCDLEGMSKALQSFRWPGFNGSAAFDARPLLAVQKHNVETLSAVNRAVAGSAQAVAQEQTEMVRDYLRDVTDGIKEVMSADAAETRASRQAEFTKRAMQNAVRHLRESMGIGWRAGDQVFEILNRHAEAAVSELTRSWARSTPRRGKHK